MHQTNPVAVVEMHGDAWVVYLASTLVIIPPLLRKVAQPCYWLLAGMFCQLAEHSRPLKIESDFESGVEKGTGNNDPSPASPYFYEYGRSD